MLEVVESVERGIAAAPALRRATRMVWSCILGGRREPLGYVDLIMKNLASFSDFLLEILAFCDGL